jgi:hypothetical protein
VASATVCCPHLDCCDPDEYFRWYQHSFFFLPFLLGVLIVCAPGWTKLVTDFDGASQKGNSIRPPPVLPSDELSTATVVVSLSLLFHAPLLYHPPYRPVAPEASSSPLPSGFPPGLGSIGAKVPLEMIPRPVEAHAYPPVDFERSSGPWTPTGFRPTYVQLLSLCAVLVLCMLLHVVRSLRLSRAAISSTSSSCGLTIGDKELCEPHAEDQLSEKLPPSSSASAPGRGWWWVDALLGRDTEEDEAAANAAHSMVIQTHHQLIWSVQDDPGVREYRDSIPCYQPRQQRPPISMAKLIMSRHVRYSHSI